MVHLSRRKIDRFQERNLAWSRTWFLIEDNPSVFERTVSVGVEFLLGDFFLASFDCSSAQPWRLASNEAMIIFSSQPKSGILIAASLRITLRIVPAKSPGSYADA